MNNKEIYKEICESEKSIPLFLTYDWLNTVAPNNWDVIIEKNENEIFGAFPYILNQRKGFKFIELIPLTPYGGPWLKYPTGQKYTSKINYEKTIFTKLINQLPPFDNFKIKFNPKISNWLPFHWKNFQQTTHYTYILKELKNTDAIFKNFKQSTRWEIKKAEDLLAITSESDISILYHLKEVSNKEKGLNRTITFYKLKEIFNLCIQKKCGELLVAKNKEEIHAAALFVWDDTTCYYLYSASNPLYKNSGGISLILWNAMQKYSSQVSELNFEGSMLEDIERFFRGFGGEQVPYYSISKTNSKLLKIKNFLRQF